MTNKTLNVAKKAKNDEFYTRLEDIEKELKHYTKHFKGKVVYCNCDDPTWSNFWRYFYQSFGYLGLKKLISTHYEMDGSSSYAAVYEGGHDNADEFTEGVTKIPLKGNGDFRSDECIEYLKQSDIVVTNPAFSSFREYIAQLEEYNKQFIVIGNPNAVTYKSIFPLIKNKKLWLGFSQPKEFDTPNGQTKKISTRWFTNVDIKKRHHKLETVYRWHKRKEKYPDLYPKYDNYDAIEVSKVSQIPLDFDGIMGVPITFLDKYNPEQFEIVGADESAGTGFSNGLFLNNIKHKQVFVNGKRKYKRIFIKNKHPEDYQNDLSK